MRRIAQVSLFAVMTAFAGPALAQVSDNSGLYDRIDRLERDVQTLQAQVANGGTPSSVVVTSPALGGGTTTTGGNSGAGSSGSGAVPPTLAVQLSDRLDQVEEQLRQLTGKVEEAEYKATQTAQQLQRMQADLDVRLKELQSPSGGQAGQSGQSGQSRQSGPTPLAANPPGPAGLAENAGSNSAGGTGLAPGPQVLGSLPARDAKAPPAGAPEQVVNYKDPQAMYDDAYAKIQKGDSAGAEAEFKAFLAKFPKHQLASNAQFWIADIAYTRKDYKQSAALFLEAYKKYPNSGKAPDMLYKAGASFAHLDPPRKTEACTAFRILFEEHAQMPEHVRRAATAERKKLQCR